MSDKLTTNKITTSSNSSTTSYSTSIILIIAIVFIIVIIILFINNRTVRIAPNCILSAPQNIGGTSSEKNTIVVGWDKVKGATEYKILRSCQQGFSLSAAINVGVTKKTTFIFNNINDINNYIKVIASSTNCDDSRPSKEIQVIVNCTANEENLNINHIDDGTSITKIKWTHISNAKTYRYVIIPYKDGDLSPGVSINDNVDPGSTPVGNEIELSFSIGDLPISGGENYFINIYANNQCGFSKESFLFIK